ncbi:major facilitator superfamily domain-containing protein [Amylocystis lapponica]|nr:major facilitator superfamily domain-containing protein [Amylocystis lapponica]
MSTAPQTLNLWQQLTQAHVNPFNGKCTTLPILNLRSQYARNFHLSWLGFWVAFLSWFAFSPLIPEAVKTDLQLTQAQIGNSNVVSLCATLLVRVIVGPLVDRYGPRKVMAGLLVIGAIPSGLAGTVHSAQGLYVVRFFIGILGGTFVPCLAWTTAFFDTRIVGRANALAGGWGNSGGGFTFMIMLALYDRLVAAGLSHHSAWRASFAIVPVPVLLITAAAILAFGTDHPAGRWSDRHGLPAARIHAGGRDAAAIEGEQDKLAHAAQFAQNHGDKEGTVAVPYGAALKEDKDNVQIEVDAVANGDLTTLDTAVNQPVTWRIAQEVMLSPLTWLPSLAYLTTFGYELAIDANLSNVLYGLYKSPSFGQTKSGYVAAIYGLMNVYSRPLGGYIGDLVYIRWGVPGKKYLTLALGALQGFMSLALGLYIDSRQHPSLAVVIAVFTILAVINEMGNGANFSLVPHCNPNSNGFMTGIVGALGNLGGVFFALIFRFQPLPYGKTFWIAGVLTIGVNALLVFVRVPRR